MHGFEDVTFGWGGMSYTVPANRQMGLVARVEDALSGDSGRQAISVLMQREGPPYSRLAAAFGAALRYAGAAVTDEEIYLSIMEDFTKSRSDVAVKVQTVIVALLMVIAPPVGRSLNSNGAKAAPEKKPRPRISSVAPTKL